MSSKRYKELRKKVDPTKKYPLDQAVQLVSEMGGAKFDQTVEVALRLGTDSKQSDQNVRGATNMPHGLGKQVRVLVFAKGAKEAEAKEAGADFVGSDDLVKKINEGWMDFDKVIASPDMMVAVSKVGKILGPRGLMPNPKTGTVTQDVGKAVKECKLGKAAFKTDKASIIHCAIGKVSFGPQKIKDNLKSLLDEVIKLKPSAAKGIYLKGLTLSATLSPGIRVDMGSLEI
ncbi:MAG TPA: 50S ribosomal protein L1 [Deltaproteobacteria bacterium]|nr:MAG: 50S ribosomal protein L1 [Deltaproteobacteria bacterium GWA2_45_12]HBF13483.1 50S ribosomal protein L1 [Deltaproteobacteria bacterium]